MPFPKGLSPKVNVITRLRFELVYNNVALQHVSHYATPTIMITTTISTTFMIATTTKTIIITSTTTTVNFLSGI